MPLPNCAPLQKALPTKSSERRFMLSRTSSNAKLPPPNRQWGTSARFRRA